MNAWERIQSLMDKTSISSRELAKIAGVVPSAVTKWKAGSSIRNAALSRIAVHFGVSTDWLVTGREDTLKVSDNAPPQKQAASPLVPRPPSAVDAALLQRLYDLEAGCQPPYLAARDARDTAAMAVPGLLLNFAALVHCLDADTAALGRLATLLYLVHVGITSDPSQLDVAKILLDKLAGKMP